MSVMFPILVFVYVRPAREERKAAAQFGTEYRRYAACTPGFVPCLGAGSPGTRRMNDLSAARRPKERR